MWFACVHEVQDTRERILGRGRMTPEGKIKAKVKALLQKYGAYWHMPVQNGMGAPALDFHVCHRGKYFGIETKADGKALTPRQAMTKREIEQAGGIVLVVSNEDELGILEFVLLGACDGKSNPAADAGDG
jgi:hypothetical protein